MVQIKNINKLMSDINMAGYLSSYATTPSKEFAHVILKNLNEFEMIDLLTLLKKKGAQLLYINRSHYIGWRD